MGNIGEEEEIIEIPREEPSSIPMPVVEPEPLREPEKVPA